MKTKVTEKFDKHGKLIERTTETTDDRFDLTPYLPQPQIVPIQPSPWPGHWPTITCSSETNVQHADPTMTAFN